jgi:hypothetical protein
MIRKIRSELGQEIAFRANVVIDDIKNAGEALLMTGVDQPLQTCRSPVTILRSEYVDAVVAPISRAGKLPDRHHFHSGDSQLTEGREAGDDGIEGSFRRKRSDMKFVQYEVLAPDPGPSLIGPSKS